MPDKCHPSHYLPLVLTSDRINQAHSLPCQSLSISCLCVLFQYDATRYMYIIVEAPELIIRGEQVGVRVTVFNYWYNDDYIEVNYFSYL